MDGMVRSNVRIVSLVVSAVALALVFAAVLRVVPTGPLPRNGPLLAAIPHLNVVVSLAAIGTILAGLRNVRRGRVDRHRAYMLASTLLFATFLVLYLYKVLLEGSAAFAGPSVVRQLVYLPLLGVHVLLAVVAVPLVAYVLLLAATHTESELPETSHPRFGRYAAGLWLVSFVLGVLVYLLLYVIY